MYSQNPESICGMMNNLLILHSQKLLSETLTIAKFCGVRQRGLACLVSPLRRADILTIQSHVQTEHESRVPTA